MKSFISLNHLESERTTNDCPNTKLIYDIDDNEDEHSGAQPRTKHLCRSYVWAAMSSNYF